MSYAARAERFLASRRSPTAAECEREESKETARVSYLSSHISQRAMPENAPVVQSGGDIGGGEESDVSEESRDSPDLSSQTSLLSRRPNPADRPGSVADVDATGGEESEESEQRADPWWDDPTTRPLPPAASDLDRAVRRSLAPILHLPPRGCIAPVACSRLGPCDRRRGGGSCEAGSQRPQEAAPCRAD